MSETSLLLERWCQTRGRADRIAVHDDGAVWTYGQLEERSRHIAGKLVGARSSLDGERVAMLIAPGGAFVATLFGILRAGGTAIVLSPLHPPRESEYFCDDGDVRTIFVSPELRERLGAAVTGRDVIGTDDTGYFGALEATVALPEIDADAPALQLYTSGTTGKPKGAIISHRNLGLQQELVAKAWEISEGDRLLHALPMHHMHGLAIALLPSIGVGASIRMLPSFDARRIWDEMAQATMFMAVPAMYTRILAAFDAADDATRAAWGAGARGLRLATSGSAALPVGVAERWRAIAGEIPVERFGMTEIGVGMTNPFRGPRKAGTVGLPLPTVETRIVGEDGKDAETGELLIRGPSVFPGYHRLPDATAASFTDGWFRTGDTVTRDEDGYFRILGRTSVDILKSGGYKLSALEIEEALREHPAILEVAVIGIPDESWGERVVACVVARPGRESECTTDLVRTFAKQSLAPYKVPKDVIHLPDLPRNAMGKVQKKLLAQSLQSKAPPTA
jgi:malonyl-CoA/methylmalonyl-CoA synthetase